MKTTMEITATRKSGDALEVTGKMDVEIVEGLATETREVSIYVPDTAKNCAAYHVGRTVSLQITLNKKGGAT